MATNYNPQIVTNGLVLCLDAANIKSYPGSGTIWNDLTGNGNNGTLTGGPTFNSANNGSIVFDGFNDYLTFGSVSTQSLGLTTSNGATLGCWLNITLLSRWTGGFVFYEGSASVDFGWDILNTDILRIWKNNTTSNTVSLSAYNNIWAYYVLSSNSSGCVLYINGNQITTNAILGNINCTGNKTLVIADHWDNSIQGSFSNIQIYNRALTASEVEQNFNATRGRYGV